MVNLIFDHRSRIEDRRAWSSVAEFPLLDSNGVVVHEDRRKNAERRGLQLREIAADTDIKKEPR